MLQINNLKIDVLDKTIIDGLNLTINDGEIHVLMGPNGVGKSSITKVLTGDKNYDVKGSVLYNGENLLTKDITEIARMGLYLVNQSPQAIEGVTNAEMLRTALDEINGERIDIFKFNKELESICQKLELNSSFIHRDINVNCSGGERKKIELLHLWMLKPKFIILDEIDSGLDVDALKVVIKNIKEYYEEYQPSILIITHESRLISDLPINYVHILKNKKIVKTGNKELVDHIIKNGFKQVFETNIIGEDNDNE